MATTIYEPQLFSINNDNDNDNSIFMEYDNLSMSIQLGLELLDIEINYLELTSQRESFDATVEYIRFTIIKFYAFIKTHNISINDPKYMKQLEHFVKIYDTRYKDLENIRKQLNEYMYMNICI